MLLPWEVSAVLALVDGSTAAEGRQVVETTDPLRVTTDASMAWGAHIGDGMVQPWDAKQGVLEP